MKSFVPTKLIVALGAALLLVGVTAPVALAAPNPATSTNGQISVSADPWPPVAGQNVVLTGTVKFDNPNMICRAWSLDLDGKTITGDASSTTHSGNTVTFTHAYPVPASTPASQGHVANATCTAHDTVGYSGQELDPTLSTAGHSLTADRTINGVGSGNNLPSTGGPSQWWLIAGLAALVTGAAAIVAGRRRNDTA